MSNFISTDVEYKFIQEIHEVGIPAPELVIADGGLHRFSTGGNRRDRNGWYILHTDRTPAGKFGCWRRGISETWRAGRDSIRATPEQRRELHRQMDRDQRQRQQEVENQQKTAAKRADKLWSSL